ncbi:hypothetical protein EF294_20255 [Gordonia oryzae]|uniref:Uncharacterized protein n=1 Tax=Gordonia oryzae TaxID=2487349 RepID=A0A3N4GVB6_9ACTN|nr:hypothetical protein [Gordonia oryzae]RPA56914.1 hypothetical protein EF294_20255 [Gordonia oryzae]
MSAAASGESGRRRCAFVPPDRALDFADVVGWFVVEVRKFVESSRHLADGAQEGAVGTVGRDLKE